MISRASLAAVVLCTVATAAVAQQGTQRQPLQPDTQAPDFTATTLEGVPIRLEQWQGKVVALNFFITWYRDAADHLDMMEELQDVYSQDGMRLLSISLDEGERGRQQVEELVREEQVAHPVVLDPQQQIAADYGVRALPAIFIVGRDGKIAYYHEGYTEGDERRLSEAIAAALGVECPAPEPEETQAADEQAPATDDEPEESEEPVCHCFRREQ